MHSYEKRNYMPTIMSFISIDPLCEKYYDLSPYAYCGNNPVNRIDPDGRIDFPLKGNYAVNNEDYVKI